MTFQDAVMNKYYQQFMDELPSGEVAYTPITTENLTTDQMREQIASSIRPTVDQSINTLKSNVTAQRASVDADAASRGMGRSTYVSDIKSRLAQSAQQNIASIESNYGATLAQRVAEAWNNQANRKATIDSQNESNRLNVNSFNAERRVAREQEAYARSKYMKAVEDALAASAAASSGPSTTKDGVWEITNETGPLVRQGNQVVEDAYSVLTKKWIPAS